METQDQETLDHTVDVKDLDLQKCKKDPVVLMFRFSFFHLNHSLYANRGTKKQNRPGGAIQK